MKGTIPANLLNRSITRHLTKKSGSVCQGPGRDGAVFSCENTMVSAAGFAADEFSDMSAGETALIIAENNMTASRALPEYMNIYITAEEECSEEKLRQEMIRLPSLAKEKGFRIIGGNTAYFGQGDGYSVTVNLLGRLAEKDSKAEDMSGGADMKISPQVGDLVVIWGPAGHFGVSRLIHKKWDVLRERFSERFLRECMMDPEDSLAHSIPGAYLMHDVSYGGVYRALYDLSEWSGFGIELTHENIPIRQDTIEIAEFFNINPYCLMGVGIMTGLCRPESAEILKNSPEYGAGLIGIAGVLTEKKEKVVRSEKFAMQRFLTPYTQDEIFKRL